jgi:hypothetical protein
VKGLAFAVLLLLPAAPSRASETLSQLITDARVLVLDAASTTRQRFTDAQITEFLNQGQRQILGTSRCLSAASTFQLAPGTTFYPLPTNYTTISRVTVGTKYLPEMSPAGLDGRSRGWEAASGYPTYYFVNFSTRGAIGFAPWPATSSDTDTVKVEYDISANDLVNASDIPYNGVNELQEYQHALAYYAAGMMAAVEGLNTQAQAYMGLYATIGQQMAKECTMRPNYLPSASGSQ